MSEIKVGDFIRINPNYRKMMDWAIRCADEGIVFEVLEIRNENYWSRHPNGEEYGIAFHHAVPVSNGLISQIKKESAKI